jgi:predicted protein tyrosine phosphatase
MIVLPGEQGVIDFLFVCSQNYQRSPTAEHVARALGYLADSAGSDRPCAGRPLTPAAIARADRIVCMEECHAQAVARMVPARAQDIEVWHISDEYEYCAPELIRLIQERLGAKDVG